MIGFGLVLALAGVILLIAGAAQALQNRAFRDAQMVTGTVINKRSKQMKNGRAYLLKLSYSVDDIAYERELGVSKTEYDGIELGQPYEVQYRPDKPKKILRREDTAPKNAKVILILGTVLLVVGVAMLFIIRLANT